MNNLSIAIVLARKSADRTGRVHVVLNLNPFGKQYVVRDLGVSHSAGLQLPKDVIAVVNPNTTGV